MTSTIIKGGNILSIGHNRYDRLQYKFKNINGYSEHSGLHAELDSIRKCRKSSLLGATIIVFGVTKAGNSVLSRPCLACFHAIKSVGIKKIIYYDKEGIKHIEKVKND